MHTVNSVSRLWGTVHQFRRNVVDPSQLKQFPPFFFSAFHPEDICAENVVCGYYVLRGENPQMLDVHFRL